MADAGRKCLAVLILLLALVPPSFSEATSPCAACGQTDIYSIFDYTSSQINATLSATIIDFTQDRDRDALEQQYLDFLHERYNPDILPAAGSSVHRLPVPNATISIFYEKSEVGADGRLSSALMPVTCVGAPAGPLKTTAPLGEASCRIDPEIYTGKCVQFYLEFTGGKPAGMPAELNPVQSSLRICDPERTAFSAMGSALSTIGAASLANPICIIGFVILGLFVASMFFSGRSPASLLDITTPLLPKPKSMSYSGLAFGATYVRMRRGIENIRKASGKLLSGQSGQLRAELMKRGFSPRELDDILALAKDAPHMGYLALRALREGKTVAQAKEIARLRPQPGKDADLKRAAEELRKMRERKGEEDAALTAVSARIEADLADKTLALITGNVPPRIAKTVKAVLDSKKSPLYYLMPEDVRDQLRVGIGSAFASGRHVSQFTKKAAKGVVSMVSATKAERAGAGALMPAMPAPKKGEARKDLYLMDIRSRISEFYKTQVQESKANAAMYLVKRILESRGVKLELSEKELLEIGKLEIVGHMGLAGNARALDADKKIRAILSSKDIPMELKAEMLMKLATTEGVSFDRVGVQAFMSKIRSIEATQKSDREKLQELHDYLKERFKVDKICDFRDEARGGFYPWVGRDSLRYSAGNKKYDDTWTFMLLHSFLDGAASAKPTSFVDSAKLMWLRLVNEMWGLLPSDPKLMPGLDEKLRPMMRRAEEYAKSLLTEEGRKKLGEMTHVYELFYNPAIAKLPMGMWMQSEIAREYGPDMRHWNADVRGFWRTFIPGTPYMGDKRHAKTTVMEQAYGEKTYSHIHRKDSVDAIAANMFYNRIRSMVGTKYPDSYYTSNSEFRFLASTYGAFKERYAQLFGDTKGKRADPSWVTDGMVENLTRRGITMDELHNNVWVRTREGSYIPFTEGREAFGLRLSDGDRVVGGKLAVNLGGRWTPFDPQKIGERMDKEKIKLPAELEREQALVRQRIFDSPSAQEGLYKHKVIDEDTRAAMVAHARNLARWAGNDKRDIAAYLVQRMCKEASDSAAMERTGLLSIRPQRDLGFVGFRKTLQKIWQPFSKGVEQLLISSFMPQANEMLNTTMQTEHLRARTTALSGRLAAAMTNPDIDPSINTKLFSKDVSELIHAMTRYRATWDYSVTRDPRGLSSSISSQLNFAAMHHHGPATHPEAVTATLPEFQGRKFRQFMEKIRLSPLSINWMIGAPFILQVRGALTSWYGYPSKHDKTYHPLHPYAMSPGRTLEGIRSLLDPFYSAIDLQSSTSQKLASLAASPMHPVASPISKYLLDPLAGKLDRTSGRDGDLTAKLSRAVSFVSSALQPEKGLSSARDAYYLPHYAKEASIHDKLNGAMSAREYGGKAVLDGQTRAHEDQAWIYKNINVVWSEDTNPGVSYLDFNYNVLADPRLATHLVSGTKFTSYFAQDEYLQKQANLGIVQRHVSAYELTEEREQEIRSYQSPRQNRMWGFMNPLLFFLNNPIWPLSYATYESVAHQLPQRFRQMREEAERRKELRFADLYNPPKIYMGGMPVGTASEEIKYSTLSHEQVRTAETTTEKFIRKAGSIWSAVFHNVRFVYCGTCHSPMQANGICPICSGKALYFNNLQKRQWANYKPPKERKK
ncbi:MAG: hypothetical protein PHY95_01870 [Candidatus ainarchaeum sp.]|nr:hypothetical protein [Candidatus ainarchaeum sp.]